MREDIIPCLISVFADLILPLGWRARGWREEVGSINLFGIMVLGDRARSDRDGARGINTEDH